MSNIINKNSSYSFRNYFELNYEPRDIIAEFGYSLVFSKLELPQSDRLPNTLDTLQQRLTSSLELVSLSSEIARREILVSPIIIECALFLKCPVNVEYQIYVSELLKGNLDYLIRGKSTLLVVEAKNDDITRGMVQLFAQLLALSQLEDLSSLYGIVTTGDVWKFGKLEQSSSTFYQDIEIYKNPSELHLIVSIVLGILSGC